MLAASRDPALKGVALGVDSRERLFFPQWPGIFAELDAAGIHPEVIFLDASDDVLARRYSESRRPHPMAASGATVAESIRVERLALAEMRERANRVIDTTNLTVHELREVVTAAVLGASAGSRMSVSIVSFGYKYGLPVGMDVVLDVRFIPNPFFVPELRPLTGNDPRVREYVMAQPESRRFIDEVGQPFRFSDSALSARGQELPDGRSRMHRRTPSLARARARVDEAPRERRLRRHRPRPRHRALIHSSLW